MPTSSAVPPLSKMTQLSPSVYLSEPPPNSGASPPISSDEDASLVGAKQRTSGGTRGVCIPPSPCPPPKLIILFTWMSAHPDHISKYLVGYRTHYPNSRILVIRSSPPDFFYRRKSTQHRRIAPAISAVLSSCSSTCDVILHVFSNGGSHQAIKFLRAYSGVTSSTFPPHVTIFDSCPGRATFKRSVLALSTALPSFPPARLLLLFLIYTVISIYWVVFIPFGIPDPIEGLRQALNSRIVMQRETKRCYVYSETDPMVGCHDVEAHAQDAAEKGFVVQTEKFEGSGHCAHVRVGGGMRYWAIVNALWQTGGN